MKILVVMFMLTIHLLASIGTISSVTGEGATVKRGSETAKALLGFELLEKDIVQTDQNSKVKIKFNDNTLVTIGKNSALDIAEYVYDTKNPSNSKTELNFFKGAFKSITGNIGKINPEKFKLKTKSATIGIRGTTVVGNENQIACTEGEIEVTIFGAKIVLKAGEIIDFADVKKGIVTPRTASKKELKKLDTIIEPTIKKGSVSFKTKSTSKEGSNSTANSENGDVKVNEDGTVEYTPKEGFIGTDTITIVTKVGDTIITEVITIEVPSMDMNLETITIADELAVSATLIQDNTKESIDNFQNLNKNVDSLQNDINHTSVITTTSIDNTEFYLWKDYQNINLDESLHYDGLTTEFNLSLNSITTSFYLDIDTTGSYTEFILNELVYFGIIGDETSNYYENSDNFGALADTSRWSLDSDGFFKSWPDKIDVNGEYYVNNENESSWGYWEDSYGDHSTEYLGHWVAGNITDVTIIQNYINLESNINFEGHIIGEVFNENIGLDNILFDNNNSINLSFDFGSGTNNFTGDFSFNTVSGQNWNGEINSGTLTTSGFSSTDVQGVGGTHSISSASFNGQYYGTEEIKSVGGVFELGTATDTAFGVFKADKTSTTK